MKILYVITGLDFGGAETQLMRMVHFVKEHTQDEVRVAVLTEPTYRGYVDELNTMQVPCTILGLRRNGNFAGAIKAYKKLVKSYRPDVIHSHMIHANLFTRLFSGPQKAIVINTVHGEEDFLGKRAKLYGMTDKRVAFTTCVSKALVKQMLAVGAVSQERALCVYNGLDTSIYRYDEQVRADYRKEFQIEEDTFNWIIAGRLSPEKNHQNLLEALSILAQATGKGDELQVGESTSKSWHLLIAGEGDERGNIEQYLAEHTELQGKISLLGLRKDVASLLSAADAFVLSSNYEGLPLVLQEAAAVGLPMVSTRVGGCDEVVLEGKNGYLVPKQNADALAEAMHKIMELPREELRQMGQTAQQVVHDEFAMEQVMKKWYALYQK